MSRATELARRLRSGPITQVDLEQAADLLDRIDALEAVAKASAALLVFGQEHGGVCWHAHNRTGTACKECQLLNSAIDAIRALKEVPRGD